MDIKGKKVLVTGVTGFLGSHLVKELLERECEVVGTVRSLEKREKYEALLTFKNNKNLVLKEANLLDDYEKWSEIVKGCDMVLHVASPVFARTREPEKKIEMATKGVSNVLKACLEHNVQKVVLTSSVAAIKDSRKYSQKCDDQSWANLQGNAYSVSKFLAEKEAWKIYFSSRGKMNLSVINPGLILGPLLTKNNPPSNKFLEYLFNTKYTFNINIPMVSMESVVDAHLKCLERPNKTRGKRYILVENCYNCKDLKQTLMDEFNKQGYQVKRCMISDCLVTTLQYIGISQLKILGKIGSTVFYDNKLATTDLDIKWKFMNKVLIDSVYSSIEKGFIKK